MDFIVLEKKDLKENLDRYVNSHMIGSINCTYEKLKSLFGEGIGPSADNKCANQWVIQLENGNLISIYDWKISKLYLKEHGKNLQDITKWNVGARGKKDNLEILQQIIGGDEENG